MVTSKIESICDQFPQAFLKSSKDVMVSVFMETYEPRSEKTGLQGFRPGPTNLSVQSQRDCTIRIAKTKALISFAV